MDTLHLKSFDWMLVSLQDYDFISRGVTNIAAGYQQSACAQCVYYAPGTTTDAERVRSILKPLNTDFPTSEQVRRFAPQIAKGEGSLGLYRLEDDGEIWYVRNQSVTDWSSPFERCQWLLLALTEKGWVVVHKVGSVKNALAVFPFLNGDHTSRQIVENLSGNEEGIALLQSLVARNLVEKREQHQLNLHEIPEFLFLGHSGLLVRSGEDILAIDPVVSPSTRALADKNLPMDSVVNHASAILITHCHWDHFYYPNLARLRRDMRMIVPRVKHPSFANPPMGPYLRELGFTRVEEKDPWDVVTLGDITLTLAAFYGEPFGLNSQFDAFTYYVQFGKQTLYGSVDACHNEDGDMENVIEKVAGLGPIDFFLFCSSGLKHQPAYYAANLRHFSNELIHRPELIRFHPTHIDAMRWAKRLNPRALIPYAEFLFQGNRSLNIPMNTVLDQKNIRLDGIPASHVSWGEGLHTMARELGLPIQLLQPMQGLVA